MAKPTKAQLLERCAELGIEADAKMTVAKLESLLEGAEKHEARLMRASIKGYIALNVRSDPSTCAPVVATMLDGEEVAVESIENGWAKVANGYIKAEFLA